MVACTLDAYDVRFEDTRRTAFEGSLLRSFFRFHARMPNFAALAVEATVESAAPGTSDGAVEEI